MFDGIDQDRSIIITEVYFEVHNTFEEVKLKLTKNSMEGPKALLTEASLCNFGPMHFVRWRF
jgi:hypothetical protein